LENKRISEKRYYKVNERIRYPEVRVITSEGENLGVLKTNEALREAQNRDLDLVVITEGANPPIAKILDFNKYLYEESKRATQIKARSKKSETKQFRLSAAIDSGAIEVKTKRAREFLEEGNKVKVSVVLKGRQKAYPEIGREKINLFITALEDISKPESEIRQMGGIITVTLIKK
jgi:translation initiation factor IF-3